MDSENLVNINKRSLSACKSRQKHSDVIQLCVPKGEREKIKEHANRLNMSMNEYIYQLIVDDINKGE